MYRNQPSSGGTDHILDRSRGICKPEAERERELRVKGDSSGGAFPVESFSDVTGPAEQRGHGEAVEPDEYANLRKRKRKLRVKGEKSGGACRVEPFPDVPGPAHLSRRQEWRDIRAGEHDEHLRQREN